MRIWMFLLLAASLAGCVSDDAEPVPGEAHLSLYLFWLDEGGRTNQAAELPNGFAPHYMARVMNMGNSTTTYAFDPGSENGHYGMWNGTWDLGMHPSNARNNSDTLAPGESRLWVVRANNHEGTKVTASVVVDGQPVASQTRAIAQGSGQRVAVGDNVQTVTVGVWNNGTIFYTNSQTILEDPMAPLGGHIVMEEALLGVNPLPVYVYALDRTSQPPSSRDNCYFTTIPGYNGLLRASAVGTTAIGILAPEDGYTRDGNEQHFLYGDGLVFMNVVVAIDGSAALTDGPDPTGACFGQGENTVDFLNERLP